MFLDEGFLVDTVLRNTHCRCGRSYRAVLLKKLQAFCRDVFKFSCDRSAFVAQHLQGGVVPVVGLDVLIGNQAGRTMGVRIKHNNAVAHAVRSQREHAAELSAAKNPEARIWKNHAGGGSSIAKTLCCWSLRNCSSLPASSLSVTARMLIA